MRVFQPADELSALQRNSVDILRRSVDGTESFAEEQRRATQGSVGTGGKLIPCFAAGPRSRSIPIAHPRFGRAWGVCAGLPAV